MGLATLKLDESSKLAFGVQITGAGGVPEARFIIEGKDFNIAFPCKQTNEGVEVEIAGLKNVLPSGEYQARLEVILENKVYTPMRDTIVFEPTVEISTKSKPVAAIKESVTVSKVIVHKPDPEKPRLEIANYIADTLGYSPKINESAASIINHALEKCPAEVPANVFEAVSGMIALAESEGIRVDRGLMPTQKIVVLEKAMEVKPTVQQNSDDEVSDEELDDMISHIQDWEHIIDAYDPEELAIVDAETGEIIDGDLTDDLKEDTLNEVLSRAERLKARVRFARTAAKRERKAAVALKKHSSSATLAKRARRLAVKTMETKLAKGKPLASLSVPEKERIERIVQTRKAMIGRLAMKLTPRIKKIEQNRLAHKTFTQN